MLMGTAFGQSTEGGENEAWFRRDNGIAPAGAVLPVEFGESEDRRRAPPQRRGPMEKAIKGSKQRRAPPLWRTLE